MEKNNRLNTNDIDSNEHIWVQGKKYCESVCIKCGMVQNLRDSRFALPIYGCENTLNKKESNYEN